MRRWVAPGQRESERERMREKEREKERETGRERESHLNEEMGGAGPEVWAPRHLSKVNVSR
jgi:hypothetical protein